MLTGDENVVSGEPFKQRGRLIEIGRENVDRIARYPRGKINALVKAGVKGNKEATRLLSDVFN